jgi:hypothetical protein
VGCVGPSRRSDAPHIRIDRPSAERWTEFDRTNPATTAGRLRIRVLIVLLAAEIATMVRMHEAAVRRWLVRYQAEGEVSVSRW